MAGKTGAEIASKLMMLGVAGDMPVVVASALSSPKQNIWFGDLAGLAAATSAVGERTDPVIIGIGCAFGAKRRSGNSSTPSVHVATPLENLAVQ
jgi:siroheme synthase